MLPPNGSVPGQTKVLAHFLEARNPRIIDAATISAPGLDRAVVCVPAKHAFQLPLSRLAIHLLGGVVPYSRSVVINLLRRKNATPVVVASSDVFEAASGGLRLTLANKGVFAAVLRTGATVVPCLVTDDGVAHFGAPIAATTDSSDATSPNPEQVVAFANKYGAALLALYNKFNAVKGRSLQVAA